MREPSVFVVIFSKFVPEIVYNQLFNYVSVCYENSNECLKQKGKIICIFVQKQRTKGGVKKKNV